MKVYWRVIVSPVDEENIWFFKIPEENICTYRTLLGRNKKRRRPLYIFLTSYKDYFCGRVDPFEISDVSKFFEITRDEFDKWKRMS